MIKLAVTTLAVLFLSGCTDGRVSLTQLQNSDKVCSSNGGVKELSVIGDVWGMCQPMRGYTIFCNDGAEFDYNIAIKKLPKE